MKRMLTGACLVLLAASWARADEAPPRPMPPKGKLVVMVDANARTPRLVVPKQMLQADGRRGDAGMLHTVMAGLALALAFTGGGIWMVRQRKGGNSFALGLVASLAVLALGASLWADFAVNPPKQHAALDNVSIVVVERGDAVQLYLNLPDLAKLTAGQKK